MYRLVAPDGSVSFTNAPTSPAYERIDTPSPARVTSTPVEPPVRAAASPAEPPARPGPAVVEPPTRVATTPVEPRERVAPAPVNQPSRISTTRVEPPPRALASRVEPPPRPAVAPGERPGRVVTSPLKPPAGVAALSAEPRPRAPAPRSGGVAAPPVEVPRAARGTTDSPTAAPATPRPDSRPPDVVAPPVVATPPIPASSTDGHAVRVEARDPRDGLHVTDLPNPAVPPSEIVTPRAEAPASPREPPPIAASPSPPRVRADDAQPGGGSSVDVPQALAPIIRRAASRHGVPERLVTAIIAVESGFNPRAVSRKGARGLMQLMPGTAAMLGVRNAFDPADNVDGGVRHLRGLLERLGQNVPLALAAYNAGEQAVVQHRGIPPYPETQDYVARIMRLFDGGGPALAASLAATLNGGLRALGDPRGWNLPAPGPARAEAGETYRSRLPDGGTAYSNIPPVARP